MSDSMASSSSPRSLRSQERSAFREARALREAMECIVLPARPGASPSGRPPVEIYLGTEPAQYRANRVFGWSIEKVRDPGREVRIYVMSELAGFDRRGWTTGFTNYRFAIPYLAGGLGRAIYNDEDQIYLTDPGVLFDHALGEAAHLSTSDSESSMMLIDCEKMSGVWTLEEARHRWKRALLRKATAATGLRGDLDPGWNARDEEFVPGQSHLLHYTTLHTQPWRPFPERFVYQKGHHTDLWHALEREAIERGFELFTRVAPSRQFGEGLAALRELPRSDVGSSVERSRPAAQALEHLARATKARTILELVPDLRGLGEQRPGRFGLEAERRLGLLEWLEDAEGEDERHDGVVCLDGLETLPVWDVPWLVEELFRRADRFVYVAVRCSERAPRRRFLLPPQGTVHTPEWWRSHFEAASHRHPEIAWQLSTAEGSELSAERTWQARGGPRPEDSPPSVRLLTDGAPGNLVQGQALAAELGWPYERFTPELGRRARLPFVGRGIGARVPADGNDAVDGEWPWPELLIVAGRRVAPLARRIRRQARGATRVVALGAKTGIPPEGFDLVVVPRSAHAFPHPRLLEVEQALVPSRRPAAVGCRWDEAIRSIPGPRLVLVVGSGTRRLGFDRRASEAAGHLVAASAEALGASVLLSASRHCASEVFEGVVAALPEAAFVHRETRDQQPGERAWPTLLEAGDIFVMIGCGETTLAELCATGRPLFLAPHEGRPHPSPGRRLLDGVGRWVARRADARPANDRGTTRPQQGLELFCARLIARGWVRPPRDFDALRGRLVRSGHARLLRAPIAHADLEGFADPPAPEVARVADRVRGLMGLGETARADRS